MENFLGEPIDDCIITPDSLAWKLLMDESDMDNFGGILQSYIYGDNNNINQESTYDYLAGQFEILITMYMEIFFGLLKIEYLSNLINEDDELETNFDPLTFNTKLDDDDYLEANFKPNLSYQSVKDTNYAIHEKFKKIRYYVSINTVDFDDDENDQRDFGEYSEYYCRIILKDTLNGAEYFANNISDLDPDKRYTFVIRNDIIKKQKKIDEFYSVCCLPNMKIKISFTPINVIIKNPIL